ncbi:MAG: hypothetical protein RLY30_1343 [Pseudomonadota bacterium]
MNLSTRLSGPFDECDLNPATREVDGAAQAAGPGSDDDDSRGSECQETHPSKHRPLASP